MSRPGTINNTIMVSVGADSPYLEGTTSGTIYPGMLVERTLTPGEYHATNQTAGEYSPLFAVENIYQGKTVDDPYLAGERVMMRYGRTGDVFLTKVVYLAAPGQLIYGMNLNSAGSTHTSGWLKGEEGTEGWLGENLEAQDLTPTLPIWVRMVIK